jgi:hypothetical protein
MEATVVLMAQIVTEDGIRLHFHYDMDGWKTVAIENIADETMTAPPSCFSPTNEVLELLSEALDEFVMNSPAMYRSA